VNSKQVQGVSQGL